MSAFLGIDPGLSGAIALYVPADDILFVADVPIHELRRNGKLRREPDVQAICNIVADCAIRPRITAWIEHVSAMPGEGAVGAFTFGKIVGLLTGVCAAKGLIVERVTPSVWKKALAVPSDKDGARARASQLLPQHSRNWPLKKHDGRAEAALIALYGSRQEAQQMAA